LGRIVGGGGPACDKNAPFYQTRGGKKEDLRWIVVQRGLGWAELFA